MRLFVEQALQPGEALTLDSFAANYISRVLRLKINDSICLFNGILPLGEYTASISSISKKQLIVQIQSFQQKNLESPLFINLLQGVSRGDRMDYTIQKAVELGVNAFYPLFLDRSNVKLNQQSRLDKKLAHWQGICNSALQQSGRTAKVAVHQPDNIASIQNITADISLLADPLAKTSLSELVLTNKNKPQRINILIGPEGGITESERAYTQSQGFTAVRLGPRILRTETAGLAIISYLQAAWGDF
ncbi:MAG: 16S rRNA (uracil(1498)-N(3))-methyltransferase [Pseudomonadota bacterium]